jgi:hypothetical protein
MAARHLLNRKTGLLANFRCGSWPCKNTKTLERDRRSYSSKTVLALKLANAFNLDDELTNVILVVFRSFAFSHSQGQKATFWRS